MLRTIGHFILVQWTWCAASVLQAWTSLLALLSGPSTPRLDSSTLNPLTDEQLKNRADEFVSAVDQAAVRTLASSYNNGLPCRIDEAATAQRSFSVCFLVRFDHDDDRTWVFKIPIGPIIHDAWGMLQSEVCTIRYIQEKTRIPVPNVHAYGQARLLRNKSTEQPFMILDRPQGQPLVDSQLASSSEEHRRRSYSQLIDIFTQLRTLQFPSACSLMPDQSGQDGPCSRTLTITNALSRPANHLEVQGCSPSASTLLPKLTAEWVSQQRRLLRDTFRLSIPALRKETAELQLFALDAIDRMPLVSAGWDESFALAHTDLRMSNIMVDGDLRIVSIVNWEWAATVPVRFFIPPTWITASEAYFSEFRSVLAPKYALSTENPLLDEWSRAYDRGYVRGYDTTYRVAEIFQSPRRLVTTFYEFIYPELFAEEPRQRVVPDYFLSVRKQLELRKTMQSSKRYTRYLRDNNLLPAENEVDKEADERVAMV